MDWLGTGYEDFNSVSIPIFQVEPVIFCSLYPLISSGISSPAGQMPQQYRQPEHILTEYTAEKIIQHDPDILLLDIEMPGISGITAKDMLCD